MPLSLYYVVMERGKGMYLTFWIYQNEEEECLRISSTNLNFQILHLLMHAQASTGCNQVNNLQVSDNGPNSMQSYPAPWTSFLGLIYGNAETVASLLVTKYVKKTQLRDLRKARFIFHTDELDFNNFVLLLLPCTIN